MQIRFKNKKNNLDFHQNVENDVDPTQRAWIEVSGKAIERNVRKLKSRLKNDCEFMAVVKADGYGHDAKFVSNSDYIKETLQSNLEKPIATHIQ